MKNMDIRQEIIERRLRSYEVAAQMNISAATVVPPTKVDTTVLLTGTSL